MAPHAKVLLYERLVEPDYRATMSVLHLDLEMMVILGGMERTEREFRALLERSGLAMTRILPVVGAPDFRLIEASAK